MRMPYIVNAGEALGEPTKSPKMKRAIRACMLGTGFGIGLVLILNANPDILSITPSQLQDIGMAFGDMLSDVAHACAEFVHYLMSMSSR